MKSIREIYKIGKGPSYSHTMGPERAAKLFAAQYPQMDHVRVTLYGSLCKTGIGHGTDRVLKDTFAPLPAPEVPDFASIIIESGSTSPSFTRGYMVRIEQVV